MRIAAIGFGNRISGVYNHCIRRICPEARLVGLLDDDQAAARARLKDEDHDAPLACDSVADLITRSRPDAVLVGTRCDSHARYAIALAPYRLPVFLEKPVATSMDDAIALERAWGADGDKVVVSFPLRLTPLVKRAQAWLAEPATGRIAHVNAVNYVTYGGVYFNEWYRDHGVTGGLFLQKATHDFDYLAHLVGHPIARVAAMALHGRVHQDLSLRKGDGDPDVSYHASIGTPESGMNEDCSSALIEFANGIHGTYSQVFFPRHATAARGATLSGRRSTISFDWATDKVRRAWHDRPEAEEHLLRTASGHGGGDEALAQGLVDLVRGAKPSPAPLQAGLESVYACLAARESSRSGSIVAVRRWGQA